MASEHGATRADLLDFITRYHKFHKHGPTYREMANHLGLRSRGSVYAHLDRLHSDGLIAWPYGKHESVRPIVRDKVSA